MNVSIPGQLQQLSEGRTEWVVDLLANGGAASTLDSNNVSLLQHCAYFGDVTAIKLLLNAGESLKTLGDDLGLHNAAFHGHWRLCQFLIEQGADPNHRSANTGETALHDALSKTDRVTYDLVIKLLLAHKADPNVHTNPGVETEAFMRDCRTKGETPLHRAAAFGQPETLELLLAAGADREARDANGDTPLSWASWYGRPNSILRPLCYGPYRIHAQNRSMQANLLGDPPAA